MPCGVFVISSDKASRYPLTDQPLHLELILYRYSTILGHLRDITHKIWWLRGVPVAHGTIPRRGALSGGDIIVFCKGQNRNHPLLSP